MELEASDIQAWGEEAKILPICERRLVKAGRLCPFHDYSQHLCRKRINEAPQIHRFGIMGGIFEKSHKRTESTCVFFMPTAKSAGHWPVLVGKVLSAPS